MAKKNEIVILDLKINVDDIKTKMGSAREEVIKLTASNKELKKSIDEALKNGNDAEASKLTKQLAAQEAEVKTLNTEIRQYQSTLTKTTQLNKANKGSQEELLRQYELASTALKVLGDQQERNADGSITFSKDFETQAAKVKQLKDAIDKGNKSMGDGRSSVGLYAESIREAFANTGLFGESTAGLGKAFAAAKQGSELFKNGIKGIGAAMTSTGIPLFANVLQILVDLFKRNEAASEAFEQAVAAIGAIFNSIIGTVINLGKQIFGAISEPKKIWEAFGNYINETFIQYFKSLGDVVAGIFTLDFDRVKNGFKGAGEAVLNVYKPAVNLAKGYKDMAVNAYEAAKAAVELTKRQQALEDRERAFQNESAKSKLQVDELIKSAKERAGSEEERIKLLDQAAEIEKNNLKEEQAIAQERLNIIEAQNENLRAQGQLKDEDDQKRVDAETHLTELKGQSAIKQQEIENRKTLLLNELNKKEIQNRIDTLNSKLAIEEANGRSTIALKKQLADQERKILLEDAGEDKAKREQIELDHQAKLIAINKQSADEIKRITQQTEDLNLSFIRDANLRELAQIALDFQRKLDALKGNYAEEAALRAALETEMAEKVRAVQEKITDQQLQQQDDRIQQQQDAELASITDRFTAQEQALKVSASKEAALNAGNAEEQARIQQRLNAALQQLKLQQLNAELDAIAAGEAKKIVALETAYQDETALTQKQFDQGKINREQYDKDILAIDLKYNDLLQKQQKDSGQVVTDKAREIKQQQVDIAIAGNQQILADEQKAAAERARIQGEVTKAITDSFHVISDVLSRDEENKKAHSSLLKTLASAEVLLNLYTEISGYWAGVGSDAAKTGNIYASAISTGLATLNSALALTRAGLAIANINKTKAFASGGHTGAGINFVDRTGQRVAGVVHENEWVAPRWMVESPRFAPVIHSLEVMRKTGRAVPFADGGFGSSVINRIISQQTNITQVDPVGDILKRVNIYAVAPDITGVQVQIEQIEQTANI